MTHFPNTAGKNGVLYRAWWCEPTDGVQKWNPESSRYLKVFKTWEWPILDCSIPGECLKISEVPLQKISAVPRNLLVTPVHVPGPDKIIAEPTVRQTVWQKLSLYLATFWFQITKQSYKKLGKKNGQLLNWFKLKKNGDVFKILGSLSWPPILIQRYENTSGKGTEDTMKDYRSEEKFLLF